ncbi:hypothetical protein [Oryzifoliimicrobium ureilyticus]|uniref:hypothetical protein n=1 Tax=Oryzifoliimicrobium ureilyticus TaxID=3113724 RepID=UPI0030765F24
MSKFAWKERAREAEEARLALHTGPATRGKSEHFFKAIEAAYPADFDRDYNLLKKGDARGAEMAIAFLEADPWFFRSGYMKQRLAHFLKRVRLSKTQVDRLETVLLKIVDERNTHEFRNYCRLARAIATPKLWAQLTERLTDSDPRRRLRAAWMLAVIEQGGAVRKPGR